MDEQVPAVLPLKLLEPEELPGDGDDGRVELPAVDLEIGVDVQKDAGGGACTEAEDGDGAWRK